jgi:hypothetical protein
MAHVPQDIGTCQPATVSRINQKYTSCLNRSGVCPVHLSCKVCALRSPLLQDETPALR